MAGRPGVGRDPRAAHRARLGAQRAGAGRERGAGRGTRGVGQRRPRASWWRASRRCSSGPCRRPPCRSSPWSSGPRQRLSQDRLLHTLSTSATRWSRRSAAAARWRAAAASWTCSRRASRCRCAIEWFGDEIESLRAFDPADQRGVGPVDTAVDAARPASSCWAPRTGDDLRAGLGRLAGKLPERLAADLAALETGTLGDAAEIWGGHLAPGDRARPPRRCRSGSSTSRATSRRRRRLPVVPGGRATRRAGERGGAAQGLAGRVPRPPRLEARAARGTHPRADLGARGRGRAAGRQPVRLARAGAAARAHRRPSARPSRRWRSRRRPGRARVGPVGAPRGAAGRRGHRGRAPTPTSRRRQPPGGLALIDRSLNGGFAGGPDGRHPGHRPGAVRDRPGATAAGPPPGRAQGPPGAAARRATSWSTSTTASRATRAWCDGRRAARAPRSATSWSSTSRARTASGCRSSRSSASPATRAARTRSCHGSAAASGSAPRTRVRKAVARPGQGAARAVRGACQRRTGGRSARTRRGSPRWRPPSRTRRPPTSCAPSLEVKADLERRTPMDRLVVGDVGYGKTEVAIRAAFKAIQEGIQVAVLVPTTVLAAQHLATFQAALRGVPHDGPDAQPVRARGRAEGRRSRASRRARSTWSSAPTGC